MNYVALKDLTMKLREETGCGIMDCKHVAIELLDNNVPEDSLIEIGKAYMSKNMVGFMHTGGRQGVEDFLKEST